MIIDGQREHTGFDEEFDYVIVGSGAAGATAARVLADTGLKIAVIEEGPAVATKDFGAALFPAMRKMFRNMGGVVAKGRAFIPVTQGVVLGGSTTINSAIMWRIPDDVWAPWKTEFGLGDALPLEELHGHWDQIERELNVRPVDEAVLGKINSYMRDAVGTLGVSGHPIRRGDKGCRGSARCLQGCPHGAKQSMLVSYLPYAEERGATLFTSAKVNRIEMAGGRAVSVRGTFHVPNLGTRLSPFTVRARKGVIVAASAVQTPGLLRKSGVRSAHLGKHFLAHPGSPLMGLWDHEVNMWQGATQGFDADEHRKSGRTKIEALALPPELAFARLPGVGKRWLDGMAEAGRTAIWAAQVRAHAQGTVGGDGLLGPDIRYDIENRDVENLRRGLKFTAEMMFAAGAKEVMLGIYGLPERIRGTGDLGVFDRAPVDPAAYSWVITHMFGTARMSVRPEDGVVGTNFAVHGTENLYVVDSSVFPTNLGVNPQQAIMGIAMHAAKQIAART